MPDRVIMPRATDANNAPLPGAKATFYTAGTTTAATVYTDSTGVTVRSQPVVADSSGVFPDVYASEAVKLQVVTADDAAVPGFPSDYWHITPSRGVTASQMAFSPITGNAATDVQEAIANNTTALDSKQASDAQLSAIAALTPTAGSLVKFTGVDAAELVPLLDQDDMADDDANGIPTQQSVKAFVEGRTPLATTYASAELAITAGGTHTLTHGLASAPKLVRAHLVCKTAEYGYAIGDTVDAGGITSTWTSGTAYDVGFVVAFNATQIKVAFGATQPIGLLNLTTGANVFGTPANWRLVVTAYA